MIPAYCPRCGKPLLPDARQCPFCGLEIFVPGPPGSSPEGPVPPPAPWPPLETPLHRPIGWGAPQPDQSSNKTIVIAGCLIMLVLVFIIGPIAIFMLTAPRLMDDLRDLATFPPDFPFPSFFP
jgi:hypothetical protein